MRTARNLFDRQIAAEWDAHVLRAQQEEVDLYLPSLSLAIYKAAIKPARAAYEERTHLLSASTLVRDASREWVLLPATPAVRARKARVERRPSRETRYGTVSARTVHVKARRARKALPERWHYFGRPPQTSSLDNVRRQEEAYRQQVREDPRNRGEQVLIQRRERAHVVAWHCLLIDLLEAYYSLRQPEYEEAFRYAAEQSKAVVRAPSSATP